MVQEDIKASLFRQIRDLEETKLIANETMIQFYQQEDKLMEIADDVQDMKEAMRFALKRLRSIGRNLLKDYVFRFFCFLILVALIVIVILLFVLPKK